MRRIVFAFVVVLSACGTSASDAASSRPSASQSPLVRASTTAPSATTVTTRDCLVTWVDHFTTMNQLVAKAEVIVRAVPVAEDVVQLKAFAGDIVSLRDARRTTFRVTEVLKGSTTPEIRVLEDVCANLEVRPGQEWLLFAYRWDPKYGPDSGGEHFISLGGPQGQFRFASGTVSGPFFTFAPVVHSYEGASIDDVLRDVRAVLR